MSATAQCLAHVVAARREGLSGDCFGTICFVVAIVIIVWCGVFVTMWYEAVVITIWAHLVASGLYYI